MFNKHELDIMPGTYKCYGDVKYLRFKVRLEILKSSMIPLSNVEESGTGLDPQYNEREEFEFAWNQKIFSPSEFKVYSENRQTNSKIEKEYQEKVKRLIEEGSNMPTNCLFSYTLKDIIPPNLHRNIFYTQDYPNVNVQSEYRSNLLKTYLHTSTDTLSDHVSLPVRNIVDNNPSDKLRLQNRSLISSCEVMFIVADLSEKSRDIDSDECFEHLLVTIKWNEQTRTLIIIPDFSSFNTPGYKVEVDARSDTRYVYKYWIINVSQKEDFNLKGIEKLTDKFVSHHKNATFSMDFEMPFKNMRNIFVLIEIKKAVDFSNNSLFIRYCVNVPESWLAENPSKLNGITPLSRCRKKDNTAAFSFTFELKLSYAVPGNIMEENVDVHRIQGPQFFFEVCSLDGWNRFRVEGYAWTTLPTSSGRHQLILNSWHPAPISPRDELKRHFIGADPQILDISFPGFPSENNNGLLSRCGLNTISSGSIHLELNVIHQQGTAVPQLKKSFLPTDHKTVMLMNSVNHILEAFKKARQRMLLAREPIIMHTE